MGTPAETTTGRRLLGFRNWKIALAVVSTAAVALVAIAITAARNGCNLSVGPTSGIQIICQEPAHRHEDE